MHRNIDIRRTIGIDAKELGRSNADHGEGQVVDQNRLPRRIFRSTKPPLTQAEADDGDGRSACAIVIRDDQSPGGRRNPEPAEIVGGHVFGSCELGLASVCQVEIAGALVSEHGRENCVALAEQLECRVGEKPADESPVGVVEAIVMPVGAVHVAARGMPAQHHQRLRIGHR